MIVWFNKASINTITTPSKARDIIAALNDVIDTLVQAAMAAALKGDIKEYKFDDGMTKTMFEYQDAGALAAQIKALQAIQQLYLHMPGNEQQGYPAD